MKKYNLEELRLLWAESSGPPFEHTASFLALLEDQETSEKPTKSMHETPKSIKIETVDFLEHLPKTAETIADATDRDWKVWAMGTIFDLVDAVNDDADSLRRVYGDIADNAQGLEQQDELNLDLAVRVTELEEWSPKDEWSSDIESDVVRLKDTVAKLESPCPINKEGCAGRCPHSEKGETKECEHGYVFSTTENELCPKCGKLKPVTKGPQDFDPQDPDACDHEGTETGRPTPYCHMTLAQETPNKESTIRETPHVEPLKRKHELRDGTGMVGNSADISNTIDDLVHHVEEICKKVEGLDRKILVTRAELDELKDSSYDRISKLEQ